MKKTTKRQKALICAGTLVLLGVLLGSFGWKTGGFNACQNVNIGAVEVGKNAVYIDGFYNGTIPKGFCGYYAEEKDNRLYVGFHFSALAGLFRTGGFDLMIPTEGEIAEVVIKTGCSEYPVWNEHTGYIAQTEHYGVYVKLERDDISSVTVSYKGAGMGINRADQQVLVRGEYIFLDNDIMLAAQETDKLVLFTIAARREDGTAVAYEKFCFDAGKEKMYLTVTAEGKIMEDKHGKG